MGRSFGAVSISGTGDSPSGAVRSSYCSRISRIGFAREAGPAARLPTPNRRAMPSWIEVQLNVSPSASSAYRDESPTRRYLRPIVTCP